MSDNKSIFDQCIEALDLNTYLVVEDYRDNSGQQWRTIVRTGLSFNQAQSTADQLNKASADMNMTYNPYKQGSNFSAIVALPL